MPAAERLRQQLEELRDLVRQFFGALLGLVDEPASAILPAILAVYEGACLSNAELQQHYLVQEQRERTKLAIMEVDNSIIALLRTLESAEFALESAMDFAARILDTSASAPPLDVQSLVALARDLGPATAPPAFNPLGGQPRATAFPDEATMRSSRLFDSSVGIESPTRPEQPPKATDPLRFDKRAFDELLIRRHDD